MLRTLDLTTALRPLLLPEETLLFVQDLVGLYRDKYKIEGYQNGHAYLTSHRICYVDNEEPRQRSVAIYLKDVDYQEFYAGFLKSSPKITLFPKASKTRNLAIRPASQSYGSPVFASASSSPTRSGFTSHTPSPAPQPREANATWICPICSFSNPVPANFDPATANANTPLPPCLACGIKPPLVILTKAAIAAMSNRPTSVPPTLQQAPPTDGRPKPSSYTECPRCTFRNHPSLHTCEMCGASLPRPITQPTNPALANLSTPSRTSSPAPTTSLSAPSSSEIIKLSFRSGGAPTFHERLKDSLIQRKWLLSSAPAPAKPVSETIAAPTPRRVGIAALESRTQTQRDANAALLGSGLGDLQALMTSAKEVILLAEQFASSSGDRRVLGDLGVTTRDMLGSGDSYIMQLARDLADLLTDDRTGILKREGGVISLVDLWALYNTRRNGIELVSPKDFDAATRLWEGLKLPLRRRVFRSGVAVVQGAERTEEKTCAVVTGWLRNIRMAEGGWGRGVTALEAAGRFGWSLGVATEELQMAEERGAVVRDVDASGVRFWENRFTEIEV